jgi:segregation and condensation protein B
LEDSVIKPEAIVALVESLLFASPEPVSTKRLAEVMEVDLKTVEIALESLQNLYSQPNRGLEVLELATGFTLATRRFFAPWVEKLVQPRANSLSQAALETLAIIAYRQPITRSEIESIRGVNVEGVLTTLLERGLVRQVGRKEGPGRPLIYGTSPTFLETFGLKSLDDLPPLPPGEGVR